MRQTPTLQDNISRVLARLATETQSLQTGEFTLRSGRESNMYLDGITLALDPRAARIIGREILRIAREAEATVIAGPALGAAPMVAAAVNQDESITPRTRGVLIREDWKNHGITGLIAGRLEKGDRVTLVDDVLTTGTSLQAAREALEEIGLAQVVQTIVLLDRSGLGNRSEGPIHSIIRMEDLTQEG